MSEPVIHALNCLCRDCIHERAATAAFALAAEARRRIEAARLEEMRGREFALYEAMGGPVVARLGLAKAAPGTLRAIQARYGKKAAS